MVDGSIECSCTDDLGVCDHYRWVFDTDDRGIGLCAAEGKCLSFGLWGEICDYSFKVASDTPGDPIGIVDIEYEYWWLPLIF